MARIFITYSRADRPLVEAFVALLGQALPKVEVGYDADISGGEEWWRRILAEIDACDLFVYLLSNESLGSAYCQAEFREALRLRKTCLPVIVQPQPDVARITPDLAAELRRRKGISLAGGFGNPQSNARLIAAIRKLLSEAPTEYQWPLSPVPVLEPQIDEASRKKSRRRSLTSQVIGFVVVTALVAGLGWLVITGLTGLLSPEAVVTPTPPPTSAALLATTEVPATAGPPTQTPTATVPASTATPTEIDLDLLVATLNSRATDAQATRDVQATATATLSGVSTLPVLDQTATATGWTATPTPNITASIEAYRTQRVETATAKALVTLPPLEAALQRAASFTGANADWEPSAAIFPDDPVGAELVLVPVGAFLMGSEAGDANERPVHEQIIGTPYWLDRTEVTRAQFAACVAAGACTASPESDVSTRDTQPVNRVTWFQARDYCAWRGMRLPTEVEWEYAARGPEGWAYPWGDEWNPENAVWAGSGVSTADVGSLLAGASWVGALDLSGNVWEWVSSLYNAYPYTMDDESNSDTNSARVLRGGSFRGDADYLRAAIRGRIDPDYEVNTFGFRCARAASSAEDQPQNP